MWKKATNSLIGFQLRYAKVIANGRYLVYYEKAQNIENMIEFRKDLKPNGLFEMAVLEDIKKVNPVTFEFKYVSRTFQFKAENEFEADHWVLCLKFLQSSFGAKQFHVQAELFAEVGGSARGTMFGSERSLRKSESERGLGRGDDDEIDEFEEDQRSGKHKKPAKKKFDKHKFENVSFNAYS